MQGGVSCLHLFAGTPFCLDEVMTKAGIALHTIQRAGVRTSGCCPQSACAAGIRRGTSAGDVHARSSMRSRGVS